MSDHRHLEYQTLLSESRRLDATAASRTVRLALLSDAATQRFVPILRALFARRGVNAEIYEGPFDAIELEVYDRDSGLYRFQPQVIVVLNCVQALRASFLQPGTDTATFVETTSRRITRIWDAIQSIIPATIIQSNFVLPYERIFGNFDLKTPQSWYATVAALNAHVAENAHPLGGVLLCDTESVASWLGRQHWFDERFWDSAKYFCALDCLPSVAENLVSIVMTSLGQVAKCVIVDLDNTLWGGVIGDDGLEGIQISAHGDGEAFYRLQLYLRALKQRGIVLAVCSKNEMATALLPFEKHPEMVLRRDDFAVFVANWNDKAVNIREIQRTLNIGLDSMIFLDDNPFERNLVRELVPGVIVPELPEDPADYVRAISELNLWETTTFSTEDTKRTELYQAEAQRREEQAGFASVEGFLQSLDMRITVERFDSFHLPRISQLMQRSNQFNLTTRRLSEVGCKELMENSAWLPLYAKLADRLSDHGLISVVTVEALAGELAIRDWLMSCRVLGRGVESYLMNRVAEQAKKLGLRRITAEYIPTAKNSMVKDFFQQFGFEKASETDKGESRWSLTTEQYEPRTTFLKPVEG